MTDKIQTKVDDILDQQLDAIKGMDADSEDAARAVKTASEVYNLKKSILEEDRNNKNNVIGHAKDIIGMIGKGVAGLAVIGLSFASFVNERSEFDRGMRYEETGVYSSETFKEARRKYKPTTLRFK